jgi:hypothetical protein
MPHELVGQYALVSFSTTHIDRAGETGQRVLRIGEIVAVEESRWAVVDADDGCHLRCPLTSLYPAPADVDFQRLWRLPLPPTYLAAEELTRDYHSADCPLVLRWLDETETIAICRNRGNLN